MPVLLQALVIAVGIVGAGAFIGWLNGDLFTDQLPIVAVEGFEIPDTACMPGCTCRGENAL